MKSKNQAPTFLPPPWIGKQNEERRLRDTNLQKKRVNSFWIHAGRSVQTDLYRNSFKVSQLFLFQTFVFAEQLVFLAH